MEDKFSNKAVSRLLKSIATAYILKNENRFKIIAYERTADVVDHMDNMFYGVSVARRGWAEKQDIINTFSIKEFKNGF